MSLPEYEDIEWPLLCLIYRSGGVNHEISSSDAYGPLADHFNLSPADRALLRHDGRNEALWHNMVQWARRKLNDRGYLAPSAHGVWRLSDSGIAAAKHQCSARG